MPNERKPIVVDDVTTLHVRYGTQTGVLILNPICGMTDCILLSDCTGHVGSMRIEPDPAAEAVDKARERLLSQTGQHIEDELNKFMLMPSVVAEVVAGVMGRLAAIDYTPEPVSEFQRGVEALRRHCVEQFDRRLDAVQHSCNRTIKVNCYCSAKRALLEAVIPEPTDA